MPDPEKIGKYQILERIGRGGMGYVYRAHDPILKRDVAIKTMLRGLSEDEELRTRFLREAQSAGGLRHPNIVTIYDLGEDEQNVPYIAMEFLTGTDLENIIKNHIELSLQKKLDIIMQTCSGLGYAHANGIVHRDIKAANIRLLDNGEVKIMDFGIAKMSSSHMTRTGMIMGTPHYMAPEQIRGEKVDGRADIFSLAVLLYELLVYRKPFPGDNPTTVLFKIIHEDPEPLVDSSFTPPEGLEEVVGRGMGKKSTDRYQTCEEFSEDLAHVYALIQQSSNRSARRNSSSQQSKTSSCNAASANFGDGSKNCCGTVCDSGSRFQSNRSFPANRNHHVKFLS
jgi:serine/threonine-protein kinase